MKNDLTIEKEIGESLLKKCFYIDFEVPENTEELRITHSWLPKEKGNLDFGLIGPDGIQIGASGNVRQDVIISEKYSTPGYDKCTPKAGKWKIIVGVDRTVDGLKAIYNISFKKKKKRWLKGDTHLHTVNSDGRCTPEELIVKAQKKNLDYIIITDHNNSVAAYNDYNYKDILVIKGCELTSFSGHINFWGVKRPFTLPYCVNTFEDFLPIYNQAKESGAVISLNHPECKNCGWHMPREGFHFDCVEVWNGPQRIDNMEALKWWHSLLLQGKKIAAVGGSDYHRDYYITDLLAIPTTVVCADSCTAGDILKALKKGNSYITSSVNGPSLILKCGDSIQGDTVMFKENLKVKIEAEKLKRNDTVIVYENERIVYRYKAAKPGSHCAEVKVSEKGFVRAEIISEYKSIKKAAYKQAIKFIFPPDAGLPVPPFAKCISNPIYFE